jgi:hypothetical protein
MHRLIILSLSSMAAFTFVSGNPASAEPKTRLGSSQGYMQSAGSTGASSAGAPQSSTKTKTSKGASKNGQNVSPWTVTHGGSRKY